MAPLVGVNANLRFFPLMHYLRYGVCSQHSHPTLEALTLRSDFHNTLQWSTIYIAFQYFSTTDIQLQEF